MNNKIENILKEIEERLNNKLVTIDIIEEIKNTIKKFDSHLYSEWKRDNFNINHKFTILISPPILNKADYKISLLEICIINNYNKLINILSKNILQISKRTILGAEHNLLYLAIHKGNLEAVKYLLQNEIRINTILNSNGETPLHLACHQGHLEIVEYLLEYGARVNAIANSTGKTPLHLASKQGHLEIVEYLLEYGARVNAIANSTGETPLHLASKQGYLEIVQYLLKHGARVNAIANSTGETPLHLACHQGHLETALYLLKNGAKVNDINYSGETPLHLSTFGKNIKLISYLLINNAKINTKTSNGETPLHYASRQEHLEIVLYLLKNGARANERNYNGETPLHIATISGNLHIVDCLLKNKAKANIKTANGQTPLNIANMKGYSEIAKCLSSITNKSLNRSSYTNPQNTIHKHNKIKFRQKTVVYSFILIIATGLSAFGYLNSERQSTKLTFATCCVFFIATSIIFLILSCNNKISISPKIDLDKYSIQETSFNEINYPNNV